MATWFQGIPVGVYLMVGLLFVLFTWEIIGAIRRFEWLRETAFHEIAQTRVEIEELRSRLSSEREAREELEYRLSRKSRPPSNFR